MMPELEAKGAIAVGGVGGSGTRLVAECLLDMGVAIGQDLNLPLDNLWYTLLFKRREVLLAPQAELDHAFSLFRRRMSGEARLDAAEGEYLRALALRPRANHDADWLFARAESFISAPAQAPARWGWKEPNTHILAEALLRADPALRYIHLYRNGLEMAFNRNQQQPLLWGPVLLGDDAAPSPARSLSYWCAAHRRMLALAESYPGRILLLRFEELVAAPGEALAAIAGFAGLEATPETVEAFTAKLRVPVSRIERGARFDALARADLDYLESLGFPLE